MTKVTKQSKKSVKRQVIPNPTGKGGLGEHPENIDVGGVEKGWTWKEVLMTEVEQKKKAKQKKKLMAEAMVDKAISGDVPAFNAVADRMEGKPLQKGELDVKGTLALSGLYDQAQQE